MPGHGVDASGAVPHGQRLGVRDEKVQAGGVLHGIGAGHLGSISAQQQFAHRHLHLLARQGAGDFVHLQHHVRHMPARGLAADLLLDAFLKGFSSHVLGLGRAHHQHAAQVGHGRPVAGLDAGFTHDETQGAALLFAEVRDARLEVLLSPSGCEPTVVKIQRLGAPVVFRTTALRAVVRWSKSGKGAVCSRFRPLLQRLVEFAQIGAGHEGGASADEDASNQIRLRLQLRQRRRQALAHRKRGGIDGRVVDFY